MWSRFVDYPKLRAINIFPIQNSGQTMICLQDPQNISEKALFLPPPLYFVISFFDGQHSIRASSEISPETRPGAVSDAAVSQASAPQVLVFGGSPVKPLSYSEIYYPTSQLIGFHTLPPTEEPLDYDPNEMNRMMQPVDVMVGTFLMKGKIHIWTQTDIGASLEVARISWMSLYDAEITNPYLPQMPPLHVPMALVNPVHVAFAFS